MRTILVLILILASIVTFGQNSPDIISQNSSIPNIDWINVNNVKSSDDQYAEVTLDHNEQSEIIYFTNLKFSIPDGSIIDGVEVCSEIAFGFSSSTISYSCIDRKAPKAMLLYRIKQVDYDGSIDYSNLIKVDNSGPLLDNLEIIKVTNLLGQKVSQDYTGIIIEYYSDGTFVKKCKLNSQQ